MAQWLRVSRDGSAAKNQSLAFSTYIRCLTSTWDSGDSDALFWPSHVLALMCIPTDTHNFKNKVK